MQVFEKEYDEGYLMYGYMHNSQIVGFLSMQLKENELCIQDIAVKSRRAWYMTIQP